MRFAVTYDISGAKELPLDYRGGFVRLIKTALEKSHNIDYLHYESAPFCFAIRFDRKPEIKDSRITIGKNIRLYASSPSLVFATSLYNGLVSIKEFQIHSTKIVNPVASYIKEGIIHHNSIIFATLSPIVIRHYQRKDRYVLPSEDGFAQSMFNALLEHWKLYNNSDLNSADVGVDILKFKKVLMTHYGGLVLGFTGVLQMRAVPNVLKFFYQSGIGYRRSNGFGFVELDSPQ